MIVSCPENTVLQFYNTLAESTDSVKALYALYLFSKQPATGGLWIAVGSIMMSYEI